MSPSASRMRWPGLTTSTDTSGRFQFAAVPGGPLVLTVQATGMSQETVSLDRARNGLRVVLQPEGLVEVQGLLSGQKASEAVNGRQADVSRGRGPAPLLLQVLQKCHDVLDREIGHVERDDRSARGAGEEPEEEGHAVAIAADGMGAHASDGGQMVTEERPQRGGQGIRGRGRHRGPSGVPTPAWRSALQC